jgi:hypothetical protein
MTSLVVLCPLPLRTAQSCIQLTMIAYTVTPAACVDARMRPAGNRVPLGSLQNAVIAFRTSLYLLAMLVSTPWLVTALGLTGCEAHT